MVLVLFLILNSSELVHNERKLHSECLNISILIKSINMIKSIEKKGTLAASKRKAKEHQNLSTSKESIGLKDS